MGGKYYYCSIIINYNDDAIRVTIEMKKIDHNTHTRYGYFTSRIERPSELKQKKERQ